MTMKAWVLTPRDEARCWRRPIEASVSRGFWENFAFFPCDFARAVLLGNLDFSVPLVSGSLFFSVPGVLWSTSIGFFWEMTSFTEALGRISHIFYVLATA